MSRRRVVVTMTCLGLVADWAYLHFDVGAKFMLIGEWGFGLIWWAMGSAYVVWLTTVGWRRAQAALREEAGR